MCVCVCVCVCDFNCLFILNPIKYAENNAVPGQVSRLMAAEQTVLKDAQPAQTAGVG